MNQYDRAKWLIATRNAFWWAAGDLNLEILLALDKSTAPLTSREIGCVVGATTEDGGRSVEHAIHEGRGLGLIDELMTLTPDSHFYRYRLSTTGAALAATCRTLRPHERSYHPALAVGAIDDETA